MKKLYAAFAAAMIFVPVSVAMADAAPPVVDNGVVGILSPNGTFKPLATHAILATQTNKFYSGTIVTTITITATTVLASPPQCTVTAAVSGISATGGLSDNVIDSASAFGTGSGGSYTCVVTQPYKWGLYANTGTPTQKDGVILTYSITGIGATGNRIVSSTFASIAVPATGATTNFTVSARI